MTTHALLSRSNLACARVDASAKTALHKQFRCKTSVCERIMKKCDSHIHLHVTVHKYLLYCNVVYLSSYETF